MKRRSADTKLSITLNLNINLYGYKTETAIL